MTVAELIEQLQKYPSEMKVVHVDGNYSDDVTDVDIWFECNIFGYDSKKVVAIHCEVSDD